MDFPRRKSPRIPDFSYKMPNYYFITVCTHDKKCIFGSPGNLNALGKIAEEHLRKIPQLHPGVLLDKYVVMPNHVHCILILQAEIGRECAFDLPVLIGQFKASVTKAIRVQEPAAMVWQRSFHDHVIRTQKSYEKIWMYIENNPLNWKRDCFWCEEEPQIPGGSVTLPYKECENTTSAEQPSACHTGTGCTHENAGGQDPLP